ncbi:MAG: hypothetical protein ACXWMZ_19140 [Vulcanimicrobiaceae bacterium]
MAHGIGRSGIASHSVAVDILLKHPLDIAAAIGRPAVQLVDDAPVRLASVEDMIALKQNTGRRHDEDDVEHLLRLTDQLD